MERLRTDAKYKLPTMPIKFQMTYLHEFSYENSVSKMSISILQQSPKRKTESCKRDWVSLDRAFYTKRQKNLIFAQGKEARDLRDLHLLREEKNIA